MGRPFKLSRRTLLQGAGTLIALPLLEAMAPNTRRARALASAASSAAPLRFVGFFHANGANADMWMPTTEGPGFTLPPTLTPLASVQDALIVFSSLKTGPDILGSHEEGLKALFTANEAVGVGTTSIDQMIARAVGSQTRITSVQVGIENNGYYDPFHDNGQGYKAYSNGDTDAEDFCTDTGCMSSVSNGTFLPNVYNPRVVFESIFGTSATGSVNSAPDAATVKRNLYRKSVLDAVLGQTSALEGKLGSADKVRLDEYLTGVRQIETTITQSTAPLSAGCTPGAKPYGIPIDNTAHGHLLSDMLVKAFECDATRVATFMLGMVVSPMNFVVNNVTYSHHGDASHWEPDLVKKAAKDAIDQWQVGQLAYLAQQLKAVPEGSGTLLDNCAIFYSSDIADPNAHDHKNVLTLLVGKGGGAFKTGRHLKTGFTSNSTGDLMMTILGAFGIHVPSFGKYGTTTLNLA